MTVPDRLSAALADRYRLERELDQGGMGAQWPGTILSEWRAAHGRRRAARSDVHAGAAPRAVLAGRTLLPRSGP
jgi:hypothetical protein